MNIDEELESKLRKEQVLGAAAKHSKAIQEKVRERRNAARAQQGLPQLPALHSEGVKEADHPYWKKD